MEIIYTKIEQLPDITGLIRTYLGVEKKINNKKNKNINSKILTKNEMFSTNNDYETCIQNTNLCVVSNSYIPIQKNIRGVDQALFLQFLDLDVFSKIHLHEFIQDYGYLINNQNNKKSSFFATIKPVVAEKDFESYKNSERVYYEPLSI